MQRKTPFDDLDRLSDLMLRSAQLGAKMALQEAGVIKNTITLAEIKKMHGESLARESRLSPKIKWLPIGKGGITSGVFCSRTEFEKFLFTCEFDFTKK